MSPIKSWKGHGVAREMHQNATKMVTIALQHIEVTNFSSVVWASTLVHFGWFWCFFAHLMCDPTTPCTKSYSLLCVQEIKKKITLVTQDKFETCHGDHSVPFWSILAHFGSPHVRPKDPSKTWSDSYPLSSVHLIQKKIMLVTQDKCETICSVLLW